MKWTSCFYILCMAWEQKIKHNDSTDVLHDSCTVNIFSLCCTLATMFSQLTFYSHQDPVLTSLFFCIFIHHPWFAQQKGRKRAKKRLRIKYCINAYVFVNCMFLFCWLNWTSWRHDKFVFTTSLLHSATAIVLLIARMWCTDV